MTRTEFIRRLKARGHNDEYIAAVLGPAIDDDVYRANERQDAYWRRVGGRDESDTNGVSARERLEKAAREKERVR